MATYTDIKCLIFSNPTQTASIDTMSLDMAAAMRQLGIGARVFLCTGDTINPQFLSILLSEIEAHPGRSFIVDINGRYDIKTGGGNFFDEHNVPKFSFLTDNPSKLIPKLRELPEKSLCGMVSNEHLDHCEAIGFDRERCVFFPHGGPPPLIDQRSSDERGIEVLFTGNIQTAPPFEAWLAAAFPEAPLLRDAMAGAAETLFSPDHHVFSTVLDAMRSAGIEYTPQSLAGIFPPIERYLINRERHRVLSSIKDHKVTVIGDVCPETTAACPNHDFLGTRTFTEVMDAMSQAKVSLNIVPSFRNGGHERMFYSLAYGSLLVTDKNEFLMDDVSADAGIRFFPDDLSRLDGELSEWLENGRSLDGRREISVSHYGARHTWVQRLLPVIDRLNEKYW